MTTTTGNPKWVEECEREMEQIAQKQGISVEEHTRRENTSWHTSQLELARERFDDPEYA